MHPATALPFCSCSQAAVSLRLVPVLTLQPADRATRATNVKNDAVLSPSRPVAIDADYQIDTRDLRASTATANIAQAPRTKLVASAAHASSCIADSLALARSSYERTEPRGGQFSESGAQATVPSAEASTTTTHLEFVHLSGRQFKCAVGVAELLVFLQLLQNHLHVPRFVIRQLRGGSSARDSVEEAPTGEPPEHKTSRGWELAVETQVRALFQAPCSL